MVHQEAKALGEHKSKYERVIRLMGEVGRRGSLPLDMDMVEAAVRFNENTVDKSKCKKQSKRKQPPTHTHTFKFYITALFYKI